MSTPPATLCSGSRNLRRSPPSSPKSRLASPMCLSFPRYEEQKTSALLYIDYQVVNLVGFFPFKTAGDALANINSISEGIVHDDLKLFLDTNLPKVSYILL